MTYCWRTYFSAYQAEVSAGGAPRLCAFRGVMCEANVGASEFANSIPWFSETMEEERLLNRGILLANSEALKCRLARRLFEGIQALKPPLQKPQLCSGEIGSPTVSRGLWEQTA
jgi:hypothetical protein